MRTPEEIAYEIYPGSDPGQAILRSNLIMAIDLDREQIGEAIENIKEPDGNKRFNAGLSLAQTILKEGGHSDSH